MCSIRRESAASAPRKMYSNDPFHLVKKPNTAGGVPVSRWKEVTELVPVTPEKTLPAGGTKASRACAAGAISRVRIKARASLITQVIGSRVRAVSDGLTVGPDGLARCSWGVSAPEYVAY